MALAIAGSQVAAKDRDDNRKTVKNPVEATRPEQIAHRLIALSIPHLIVLRYVLHCSKTTALRSFAPRVVLKIASGWCWALTFHSVSACLIAASALLLHSFTEAANPHRWGTLVRGDQSCWNNNHLRGVWR